MQYAVAVAVMKIACVDKTASDRVKLQKLFDDAYQECRQSVGHVSLCLTFPASKEEVLLNSSADVVAIGPEMPPEEAYSLCQQLRHERPGTPVLVFLRADIYSLRSLRRFEKVSREVFSASESPIRLVHTLSTLESTSASTKNGKLVVVTGVKGGVGTTSIVSGLAHAAEALGKSAVVLDLSEGGALIQYLATDRWQSADFTAALTEGLVPDQNVVERLVTTAPNGVNVLLPPAGGPEIRELWLRHPDKFEITLGILDVIREMFDVVLVDTGAVEGVLYFALHSRATSRLLVTSNDPASVHLLNSKVSLLSELSGVGQTHILINLLNEKGLSKEDVIDFLYLNDNFTPQMATLAPFPHDTRGRNWIGTGNTFYTESGSATQELLEEALDLFLQNPNIFGSDDTNERGLFAGIKRIALKTGKRDRAANAPLKALPEPQNTPQQQNLNAPRLFTPVADGDSNAQLSVEMLYTKPTSVEEASSV